MSDRPGSFGYFLSSSLDSIRSNRGRTALATLSVMVPLYVLGIFLLIGQNFAPYVETLRREPHLVVFLQDRSVARHRQAVEEILRGPEVDSYRYISPDEAYVRLARIMGDTFRQAQAPEDNPLPASFEATLNPEAVDSAPRLIAELRNAPGVEEVASELELVRRLSLILLVVRLVGAFLSLVLAGAAVITMSNTVRLVFLNRRDEVGILKLVGATDGFIKGPFLLEGTALGTAGGFVAALLLSLTYVIFLSIAARSTGLVAEAAARVALGGFIPFTLVVIGSILGLLSSHLALRQLLGEQDSG